MLQGQRLCIVVMRLKAYFLVLYKTFIILGAKETFLMQNLKNILNLLGNTLGITETGRPMEFMVLCGNHQTMVCVYMCVSFKY